MQFIDYSINESVALVRLNRPEKFNSFTRPMALEMQEALDLAAANDAVRAIVITGTGKAFCAGQDLGEAIDPNGPGLQTILSEGYNPIIARIRNLKKPVIAAVNGVAAGAGANIALACDVVVATEAATFIQAFSKIGLIPDSGGTFFLPRLIGFQRASALMLLGDKVTAKDALQMGMIYNVFLAEEWEEKYMQLAQQLAGMPTLALGKIKEALNASFTQNLEQQLSLEEKLQLEAGASADYAEGVQAFLEKRSPQFTGK